VRELVRGRLGASGPVRAGALAALLQVDVGEVECALAALELEGTAMRGQFDPALAGEQWCERHLLARIHRNTLGRLRREIEPVSLADAVRFLTDWQHVSARCRLRGPDALAVALGQLEGWEAAAGSWEAELLPARLADYGIDWLDAQCSAGRVAWARLRQRAGADTGKGGRAPVRATPLVLVPRRELGRWAALAGAQPGGDGLSSRALRVVEALRSHGALFFEELQDASGLLHVELEEALAELVARGAATCDSWAGLRALLLPQGKRPPAGGRRLRRGAISGIRDAGRWSLARGAAGPADAEAVEHVAKVLLRRYGVVAWRLLEREAAWLPPWRELVRVYRRMEARGELRGGRFVAGIAGEQYALPEAVAGLREVRARPGDGEWIAVAGSDPLNLAGTLLPGEKLPRQSGARLLLRDGVPVARKLGTQVDFLVPLSPDEANAARQRLLRDPRLLSHAQAAMRAPALEPPAAL
jgi:ATP-dependent Lhr-like helicase